MAIVDPSKTKRFDIPHEPGEWVDVRVLMAGDVEGLEAISSTVRVSVETLANVLVAWSYPHPITVDTIRRLDLDTFLWLNQSVLAASGVREEEEKKDSSADSSPTLARGRARSRQSSAI